MASPLTVSKVRERIRAGELIDKVQSEVLDKSEFKMSAAEVGAIKMLLNKVIPDLKGVEVQGQLQGDITHSLVQVEYVSSNESSDS